MYNYVYNYADKTDSFSSRTVHLFVMDPLPLRYIMNIA